MRRTCTYSRSRRWIAGQTGTPMGKPGVFYNGCVDRKVRRSVALAGPIAEWRNQWRIVARQRVNLQQALILESHGWTQI